MIEKTYDRPMKNESSKSFNRYTIYRDLSPEIRSIEKTAEIILENEGTTKDNQNYQSELKKMINALKGLSARWFWVERSLISDSEKLLKEQKEHEKEFREVNRDLIDNFKMIIEFCKKRLIDVNESVVCKSNGEEYTPLSLVRMVQDITFTLKTANEQIRLCFGLSTNNENINHHLNGSVDVEVDVGTSTIDRIKEIDEELADLYESNRNPDD